VVAYPEKKDIQAYSFVTGYCMNFLIFLCVILIIIIIIIIIIIYLPKVRRNNE